ncbi:cyclophilin-like domain-containing protein, partial [Mycena filopes]
TGEHGFVAYANSEFHRTIPKFLLRGGGVMNHNCTDGKSIYGRTCEGENFLYQHNRRSAGFFITTIPTPHRSFLNPSRSSASLELSYTQVDDKHVVFGEVVDGIDLVKGVEGYGAHSGAPTAKIIIGAVSSRLRDLFYLHFGFKMTTHPGSLVYRTTHNTHNTQSAL